MLPNDLAIVAVATHIVPVRIGSAVEIVETIGPVVGADTTEKLVADIERRGLCPGERYLTTDEVSRMLGVRKAVVSALLDMPERPTACITRLSAFGHAIAEVATDRGLKVPDDLEVVLDNEGQIGDAVDVSQYPRVDFVGGDKGTGKKTALIGFHKRRWFACGAHSGRLVLRQVDCKSRFYAESVWHALSEAKGVPHNQFKTTASHLDFGNSHAPIPTLFIDGILCNVIPVGG